MGNVHGMIVGVVYWKGTTSEQDISIIGALEKLRIKHGLDREWNIYTSQKEEHDYAVYIRTPWYHKETYGKKKMEDFFYDAKQYLQDQHLPHRTNQQYLKV
jgi:hypothetical protein